MISQMPRDLPNAGQSPFDVARAPSSVARDMVLGSLTKSKKMALAGDPLTPHQKMFQIKEISMEIDEMAIKINEITLRPDEKNNTNP